MFTPIRNKLEDFSRAISGKEKIDEEIALFLQDKYKEDMSLHGLDNAKFELKKYFDDLELRPELLQNKTALDIGSSRHFFDEYCKEKYNTNFVALDIHQDSLGDKHDMGVVADARALSFKESAFDLVISHASMPHLFAPFVDLDDNLIAIEGEVKKKSLEDILDVFREAYRVIKKGGQIRMSTFSERGEAQLIQIRKRNNLVPYETESMKQQLARVKLIKEALDVFEKESRARCIFKDEEDGGLIIITKV